ncbi:MAG: hypothetical protein H0W76_01575 [Pyrinomonadaceae bacterium]|nr:hypothetical protein [Pyrinomonadaceae bacterium]
MIPQGVVHLNDPEAGDSEKEVVDDLVALRRKWRATERASKKGKEMSEDIPDDYIAAAARVVEAARDLDDATRAYKSVQDVVMDAYKRQDDAQKKLQEALENLTQASTGRERKS